MYRTAREQIEAMSKAERDRLHKRLLAEAAIRLGARRWRQRGHGIPPGAAEAHDIVGDVLVAALRSPAQVVDLYGCLRDEIVKKVDALRKRAENRDQRIEDFSANGREITDPKTVMNNGLFSTEQAVFRSEIEQFLNPDPTSLARRVFALTGEECSPKYIATRLNVGIKEIYEERKKTKKYFNQS
jgi:hypothetical protein